MTTELFQVDDVCSGTLCFVILIGIVVNKAVIGSWDIEESEADIVNFKIVKIKIKSKIE